MTRIIDTARRATLMPSRPESAMPRSAVESVARVISLLIIAGTVAGAGAFVLSAQDEAHAEGSQVIRPLPILAARAAEASSRPASSDTKVPWIVPPPVDRMKTQERLDMVDPAPASAPPSSTATPNQAPVTPAITQQPTAASATSPTPVDCLPGGLRQVLRDVEARFGPATLVSTTELHTDNHSRGSVRHKLHAECKAVDFKVRGDVRAVVAYLRSRPEVAGINTFGNNGVIHIDHNARARVAQR